MATDPAGLPASAASALPSSGSLRGQRSRARGAATGAESGAANRADATRIPRRRRKVRKVHRVVRHVEVWSVLKLSVILVACGYVVALTSGYLLWRAADRVGTIAGIEGFFEDAGGYDRFEIVGSVVFRVSAVVGLLGAFLTVFICTLGAVLFNLISDITGGIRMTVIDEDLIVAPARRPRPAPPTQAQASPTPAPGTAPGDGPGDGPVRDDGPPGLHRP